MKTPNEIMSIPKARLLWQRLYQRSRMSTVPELSERRRNELREKLNAALKNRGTVAIEQPQPGSAAGTKE